VLLVVRRNLPRVRQQFREDEIADTSERVTERLARFTVPSSFAESYRALVREEGQPATAINQDMMLGIHGAPMDVGGLHGAVPTVRDLPDRTAQQDSGDRLGNRETPGYGEGVLVGVVDTGAGSNSWLDGGYLAAPNDFEQLEAQYGKGLPAQAGHGTFVTGLILKQAPAASVWMERGLKPEGNGLTDVIGTAAKSLVQRGVSILNLSLGVYEQYEGYEEALGTLVDDLYAMNPHLVIVAAAGNIEVKDNKTGDDHAQSKPREAVIGDKFFPAALPRVLAVGSTQASESAEPSDEWATWSNRGDWLDFAACGEEVLSSYISAPVIKDHPDKTDPDETRRFAEWSGTSFSAAIVSGAIAAKMTESSRISAWEAVYELQRTGRLTADDGGHGKRVPIVDSRRWDWR
jgi:hypothetical protein